MGKRNAGSTKGGRFVNPTDQARKDARRKELLKNRKQRQAVREAVIKAKDPEKIIEELMQADQMQYNPRIECPFPERVMEDRRKRLLATYERIVSFADKDKTNDASKTAEYRKALATYESNRRRLTADFHAVKLAEGTTVELLQALPTGVPLPEEEEVEPMFKFSEADNIDIQAVDDSATSTGVLASSEARGKFESASSLLIRLSDSYDDKAIGRLPCGPPPLPLPDMLRDEFISLSAAATASLNAAIRAVSRSYATAPVDEEDEEELLAASRASRPYAAVPPPEFAGKPVDDRPVDPTTGQPLPNENEMYFNGHLNRQHGSRPGTSSTAAPPGSMPPRPLLHMPSRDFMPPLPGTFARAPFPSMASYRTPMMGGPGYKPVIRNRHPWPLIDSGPAPVSNINVPAATIIAQPQLKNLAKDVTKMVPTAVASHLRPGVGGRSDGSVGFRPASLRMFRPQATLITTGRSRTDSSDSKPRAQLHHNVNSAKSVDSAYQDFLEQMKGFI